MSSDERPPVPPGIGSARLWSRSVAFELVGLPPGEFMLGSPPHERGRLPSEGPRQRITISRGFLIGRYPVTQAQYRAIMGDNPSRAAGDARPVDELPVNQVKFSRALEFCRRLAESTGLPVALPTSAQWEYACRAGTTTRFCGGDADEHLDRVGWYRDNAQGGVHPVGLKEANAWGLFDTHGNVWEMCQDILPPYDTLPTFTDPVGQQLSYKGTMRGGGWMHGLEYCRSATSLKTNDRFGGTGLRIVVNRPDLGV